jgi:hypothetical protein
MEFEESASEGNDTEGGQEGELVGSWTTAYLHSEVLFIANHHTAWSYHRARAEVVLTDSSDSSDSSAEPPVPLTPLPTRSSICTCHLSSITDYLAPTPSSTRRIHRIPTHHMHTHFHHHHRRLSDRDSGLPVCPSSRKAFLCECAGPSNTKQHRVACRKVLCRAEGLARSAGGPRAHTVQTLLLLTLLHTLFRRCCF